MVVQWRILLQNKGMNQGRKEGNVLFNDAFNTFMFI